MRGLIAPSRSVELLSIGSSASTGVGRLNSYDVDVPFQIS